MSSDEATTTPHPPAAAATVIPISYPPVAGGEELNPPLVKAVKAVDAEQDTPASHAPEHPEPDGTSAISMDEPKVQQSAYSYKLAMVGGLFGLGTTIILSMVAVGMFVHLHIQRPQQWSGQRLVAPGVVLPRAEIISASGVRAVLERNLFHQNAASLKTQAADEADAEADAMRKTRLPLRLVGTVYGSDPYSGIAMIEDTTSKTVTSFVVGHWIAKNVRVHQILRARVVLDNGGTLEYLEQTTEKLVRRRRGSGSGLAMMGSMSSIAPGPSKGRISEFKEEGYEFSGGKILMTESYKNKLLTKDFTKILQDMKADPHMKGKKLIGFKLSRIRRDSIYEKAGLANGDIVTEINGVELTSVSQAISVLQAARNSNRLEATIIQEGTPQTIEIVIGQ